MNFMKQPHRDKIPNHRSRISYQTCLKHHFLLVEHLQVLTEYSDLVRILYQVLLASLESEQDQEQIWQEYHRAVHEQFRLIQIHGELVREHLRLVQAHL
jgi:hypothetical protein